MPFTYVGVLAVIPAQGTTAGGESVSIRGFGFNAATGVTFGGVAATDVVIVSNALITATTPAHNSGSVDVAVLGVDVGPDLYTYVLVVDLLPPIPYYSPLVESPDRITQPWMNWLTVVKARIESAEDISAEQITGVLNPDQIPELPWSRISKVGSSLADLETRSASDLNAGTLKAIYGGTGFSAYAVGDLLYADSAFTLAKLADVSAGSYLRSGGVGAAPVWSTLKLPNTAANGDILLATGANIYASQSPAALTKVDDTNVTLTLGGTPATSLIKAVSLTLGWTGVLSVARGGTGTGTAFTAGSVVFAGASGVYSQDNATFFWSDSNSRLGIGTAAPGFAGASGAALTVNGPSGQNAIVEVGVNAALIGSFRGLNSGVTELRGVSNRLELVSTSAEIRLNPNNAEAMRITTAGNALLGTTTSPGAGTAALIFGDGTAPSSMASNTAGLYANDVGGTVELFGINEANEHARLTGIVCRNSAQFDAAATTTLATVTGLSRNVAASTVYRFEAVLFVTADAVGGSKFAIAGSATATAIIYDILLLDEGTNAYTITSRQTALGGSAGQVGTASGLCRIVGTIVVNAAGTLLVQFAQNVASGTSSIVANSSFELAQVA